jgi:hypothetical protein
LAGKAQQKDTVAIRFSKTITANDLEKHLRVLASDEYEGRETGMKGQKMAADYISAHFKNSGIAPLKDGTYFQVVPLMEEQYPSITVSINGKEHNVFNDYYYLPWQPDTSVSSDKIVFAGYGISEQKYDDYKGLDVKGKIVMVLSREPEKDSISYLTGENKLSKQAIINNKARLAAEKGALALIIVSRSDDEFKQSIIDYREKHLFDYHQLVKKDYKGKQDLSTIPVIIISETVANEIMASSKQKAGDIRNKINKKHKPVIFTINVPAKIESRKKYSEMITENVLGYVEGSDLKNELVVVTAHYDHLGVKDGKVYNGADDDGSGTVAVMELAEAFIKAKKEGKGPKRSMLFMTVSGEEKGLLGSAYYSEHPVFPLENTVADLNIDMIGRMDEKHSTDPDYIYIIGSNMLSTQLHEINEQANNTYTQLKLDYTFNDVNDKNRYYYRSDHYNFAKHNIPVIFYFNGVHKDYHKETDEVDKINFDKMEKISRLVFFTAWELANRKERITVDKVEKKEK